MSKFLNFIKLPKNSNFFPKWKMGGIFILIFFFNIGFSQTPVWTKHEIPFQSSKTYDNPIYDVSDFIITFTAPSGREKVVQGFWDGGTDWKVRFMPDEIGQWKWKTNCSDSENQGLNKQSGTFECIVNNNKEHFYQKGVIGHEPGKYYLSYNDGTPYFWLACTAWNGALLSTDEEWEHYLNHRKENNYNTIQLVATEWKGSEKNAEGLTAVDGTGYIKINPEFFKRIDKKIDEANAKGLLVSPVVLWALPKGMNRHWSLGYILPLDEATLVAKYIVARYQGNHVVWTLGGDGKYVDDQELKWKEIGRSVFNDIDHAPVTLHPYSTGFVGDIHAQEDWYNLMSYQSGHHTDEKTINWINNGPMAEMWSKLKPMPYINMEPNYEEIGFKIYEKEVRNAAYWSIFATPLAGVTYGADGVYKWSSGGGRYTGWRKSIDFPGSIQMGYLAEFINQHEWWNLFPANEILADQPGKEIYNHWVSVVKSTDDEIIIAYIPEKADLKFFNPKGFQYSAQWFNPKTNEYNDAQIILKNNTIQFKHDFENDMLIVFSKTN